ncbi:ABC transporter permease [Peribacillus cavernae]|uniref:ABC transporter permease n=1 Tax=Peribacillus cavernae TaxID=1674310 RepID=UPI001FECFBAD|nr:ABC transporter permease [Peribacillus cavernae]MDQ0218768.1 ABC-type nitrate/sulfonate/bicarbonate transport system permease component [Peribacillus cavernae]
MKFRVIWKKAGAVFLLFGILVIWELAVNWTDTPAWLLPAPSDIFSEAQASYPDFFGHVLSTIYLTLLGFLIGSSVGFLLAVILHILPKIRDTFYPILILSQNVPIIVLAPLLIIWLGFGILPKIIVIGLVCFFPVAIAALDGLKNTSSELKHYLNMMGATKYQLFWKLELPHALPSLFSGLKISATYSVMGAVISEWLGAKTGVGVYMTLASSSFRTDRVFVAIFTIMLLSLLFFFVIVIVERIFTKWHTKGVDKSESKH